ncbi:MAG: response regulator transcription factor [Candidatus Muirbacterium halophilum]|nr:response regulator transcription factor [Candidatus Muirbacterium halophilum]MCK9474415.1 response regulator transcription factor [Candidatus Muirbacterium halophilum]
MAINLLVADDHNIVVDGLKLLLDKKTDNMKIVAVANTGSEVFELIEKNKNIDIFIIDIEMPEMSGLDIAKKIIKNNPDSKIIIFSTHSTKKAIEQALDIGVKGYLTKEDSSKNLISAINEVYEGNTFFSQKIANYVFNSYFNAKKTKNELSARESEVLKLIAEGFSKQEIADKLAISINTVNIHRKNIMGKLDIHNAVELTKYAIKEGFITLR